MADQDDTINAPFNGNGRPFVAAIESGNDNESDYGDLGDDAEELKLVDQLLSQAASKQGQNAPFAITDIEDYEPPRGIRLRKVLGFEETRPSPVQHQNCLEILRRNKTSRSEKREDDANDETRARPTSIEPEAQSDSRSPLERFRQPPKKALSVTDLVSPAWCELQYFYVLSKHGRKRRTPAMKQGTQVHAALEAEIHVTVPVEITKREDSWGLRIWNITQGLRTLHDTGKTRELEVWGTVGGQIVNGVIDELSYECPDPELESQINGSPVKKDLQPELPEYQTTITQYLSSAKPKGNGRSIEAALQSNGQTSQQQSTEGDKRIYITDIKTRGSPTLPSGTAVKPTILQLHLYHHMLENIAQGNFTLHQLAQRYELNPEEPFSDSFIAQIGNLNQDPLCTAPSQSASGSSQDSIDILLSHNNLSSLWGFMLEQFRRTFLLPISSNQGTPTPTPQSVSELAPPPSQPTRLSPILSAEYLSHKYRHGSVDGKKLLGRKSFVFNPDYLKAYLDHSLEWWHGERKPRGVMLEDAWKCRSCEFSSDCEWLRARQQESLREVLERRSMQEISKSEV